MKTVRTVTELRETLAARRRHGSTVGLVPTMGALHEGHLTLIRAARGETTTVVVSLFVNPTQFNEGADLDNYPRTEAQDAQLAAGAGADILFAPAATEIYPSGFDTTISVGGVTEPLEGAHRGRSHFDGVATVVAKLLNMVGPDVAYFGQKDAQQALVIQKLVRDLNFRARIAIVETVREPDGLAMSSRNVHLSPADRQRATALNKALRAAADLAATGVSDAAVLVDAARGELSGVGLEPEYLELVDATGLQPVHQLTDTSLLVLAVRLGTTRLIDNRFISPSHPTPNHEELTCDARC